MADGLVLVYSNKCICLSGIIVICIYLQQLLKAYTCFGLVKRNII